MDTIEEFSAFSSGKAIYSQLREFISPYKQPKELKQSLNEVKQKLIEL